MIEIYSKPYEYSSMLNTHILLQTYYPSFLFQLNPWLVDWLRAYLSNIVQ